VVRMRIAECKDRVLRIFDALETSSVPELKRKDEQSPEAAKEAHELELSDSKTVRSFIMDTCQMSVEIGNATNALEAVGIQSIEDLRWLGGAALEAELERLGEKLVLRRRLRECVDQNLKKSVSWWAFIGQMAKWPFRDGNFKVVSVILILLLPFLPASLQRLVRPIVGHQRRD